MSRSVLNDKASFDPSVMHPAALRRSSQTSARPWVVVIPFKGAPNGKSRLGGIGDVERSQLAFAFLEDTIAAVRSVAAVVHIVLVSNDSHVKSLGRFASGRGNGRIVTPLRIISDPGHGQNAAVLRGIAHARRLLPTALVAAMPSDLPCLEGSDLRLALDRAAHFDRAFVADSAGTGTTMITVRPGVSPSPQFGSSSRLAHEQSGHRLIEIDEHSGLRFDIDTLADLHSAGSDGRSVGASTLTAMRTMESLPLSPAHPRHTFAYITDQRAGIPTTQREG